MDYNVIEIDGIQPISGELPVVMDLPTGAATEAKQDTNISALGSILSDLDDILVEVSSIDAKDFATQTTLAALNAKISVLGQAVMASSMPVVIASNQTTIPVSQASQPLPTGAATQTTLAAINTKLSALGQALMAASMPVTIASNQSTIPTKVADGDDISLGAKADAAATTDSGTFSLISLFKRLLAKFNSLGQKTMAGSVPVVLASDQTTFPINMNGKQEGGTYLPVLVDASGRLIVNTPPPEPPVGTTSIIRYAYGDVAGSSYSDTTYVIPNGVTFYLTYFASGGSIGTSDYSVIELWYCPNGTVDGSAELLDAGFTPNDTRSQLGASYLGNGTKAIVLRRKRLNAGTVLLYGRFQGYY